MPKGVANQKIKGKRGRPPKQVDANQKRRWIVGTLAEVAQFFGRSAACIKNDWRTVWPGECQAGNGWDLAAIAKWSLSRQKSPDASLTDVNRRKRELEILNLEQAVAERRRRNQEAEGSLLSRQGVELEVKSALRSLRDAFLEIPSSLVSLLGPQGPVVAEEMRRRLERACHEFSDKMYVNGHEHNGAIARGVGSLSAAATGDDVGMDLLARAEPKRQETV